MNVYYATDRATASVSPLAFGGSRDSTLHFGRTTVTFPPGHRVGEIEAPSIWRLQLREDATRDVVVTALKPLSQNNWLGELRTHVGQSRQHAVFLFVHGYNVTFTDAVKRTAQIAYDVRFDGPAVLYSWPSRGKVGGYVSDETTVQTAADQLKHTLQSIVAQTGASDVYLVAHSMGNRALTEALSRLSYEQPGIKSHIREVVLAAPDIDAAYFRTSIAPRLPQVAQHVTLYASSHDLALAASKRVHSYTRAGQSGAGLLVVSHIDTIDASAASADMLGHSYIADAGPVIEDLRQLIALHRSPPERHLRTAAKDGQPYWLIAP